jgi:serine/threonine kinase 33
MIHTPLSKQIFEKYLIQVFNDLKTSTGYIERITFMKFFNLPLIISDKLFSALTNGSDELSRDLFCEPLIKLFLGSLQEKKQMIEKLLSFEGKLRKPDIKIFSAMLGLEFHERDFCIKGDFIKCLPDAYVLRLVDHIIQVSNIKISAIEYFSSQIKLNSDTDDDELKNINDDINTHIVPLDNILLKNKFHDNNTYNKSFNNRTINFTKAMILDAKDIRPSKNHHTTKEIKSYPQKQTIHEGVLYKIKKSNKLSELYLTLFEMDLYYFKEGSFIGFHHLTGVYITGPAVTYINKVAYYFFAMRFRDITRDYYCKKYDECEKWVKVLRKVIDIRNIEDYYKVEDKIGQGCFAVVRKGYSIKTNQLVAVKILSKKSGDIEVLYKERDILNVCKSSNSLVKLIDCFEDEDKLYLVMEYLEHQFSDYLESAQVLKEDIIKDIIFQLAKSIKYLHDNGIVHRDLKPDNIMITETDNKLTLKLMDFGLSHMLLFNDCLCKEVCGTLLFLAPEVLNSTGYNEKVDIWSLGCILYCLLFGKFPFDIFLSEEDFMKSLLTEEIFIPKSKISKNACDLLTSCLEKDYKNRISISDVISHKWFCE